MKKTAHYFLYVGISVALVQPVFAETVISNSVTTEANTGGGGKASVSTQIYTEVNGEVVTDIYEEKESSDGSPVSIEKEVIVEVNNGEVKTYEDVHAENRGIQIEHEGTKAEATTPSEVLNETETHDEPEGNQVRLEQSIFTRFTGFIKAYVLWWL